MLNGGGNMHGGCIAFLVDMYACSLLPAVSTSTLMFNIRQYYQLEYHSFHDDYEW